MIFGLVPGTLDVMVLKVLAAGANHGYGVAKWLRDTTDGLVDIEHGALYTALHKLEKQGLLESEWGTRWRAARRRRQPHHGAAVLARTTRDWQVPVDWSRRAAVFDRGWRRREHQ